MFPDLSLFPPEYEVIAFEVWTLLEAGPRHVSEIAHHCREQGLIEDLVPGEFETDLDLIDEIAMSMGGIWTTNDQVAVRLDQALVDRVFTHRLTEEERAMGSLFLDPDLSMLDADLESFDLPLLLADDRELRLDYPIRVDEGASLVVGPSGWLDQFSTGDLLAFTKVYEGRVDIAAVDTVADGREETAAIRSEYDRTSRYPDAGYDLWPILTEILTTRSGLFLDPVPPLSELLASADLNHRGGLVGPAGTDWRPATVIASENRRAELAETYDFDVCCHAAFDTVIAAWDWGRGPAPDEPNAAATVEALDHGYVAQAFTDWIDPYGGDITDLAALYESLAERSGRRGAEANGRAAWIWFVEGEMDRALENAEKARSADPDDEASTALFGFVAAIQGDHEKALRLLRRSQTDGPWLDILSEIFEPFPDAKRNEPCPCGSGSKFKVCCARSPKVSDIQRMHLLSYKMIEFLHTVNSWKLHHLGHIAASADERIDPNDIDRFVNHPFIIEIAAFEGSIDRFAALWGPLLPQDERDTIDLWRTSTRALWEVTEEPQGPRVKLRDTRTGDTITVYDETGAPSLHGGKMLLGVVVPAFGEDRFLGNPLAIDLRHRDVTMELLDGEPAAEAFADWFGFVTAPPRMQTTEGQDMVICRAVCEPVSTWGAVEAELNAHFESINDVGTEWHATFVNDAGEIVVRGTMRLEGSGLIVEAMSEARFDDILDTLTTVTATEESREPVAIPHPLDEAPTPESPDNSEDDPEVTRFVASLMRQREEAWLDEEIPALGGITPRQAAADPTRRGDLIDLLGSFPRAKGGASQGFDPDRLRRLLGLE